MAGRGWVGGRVCAGLGATCPPPLPPPHAPAPHAFHTPPHPTPHTHHQVIRPDLLRRGFAAAAASGAAVTDDVSLVEALGEPVAVTPGSYTNIKAQGGKREGRGGFGAPDGARGGATRPADRRPSAMGRDEPRIF